MFKECVQIIGIQYRVHLFKLICIFSPDMSPFSSPQSRSLRVRAGHAAVLQLPGIDSSPEPSVTWQVREYRLRVGKHSTVFSMNYCTKIFLLLFLHISVGWQVRLDSSNSVCNFRKIYTLYQEQFDSVCDELRNKVSSYNLINILVQLTF